MFFYILGHLFCACGVSNQYTFNNRSNSSSNSLLQSTVLTQDLVTLSSANTTLAQYPKQLPNVRFYKGNLHTHTKLSDGKGNHADAYLAASQQKFDFYGVSDHSDFWLFPFQKEYQKIQSEVSEAWKASNLLALWGFEHSTPWLGDLGHFVVHGSPFFRSSSQDLSLGTFYEWLIASSSPTLQVSFAHPGFHWYRNAREFEHFKYEPKLADVITGMETLHWNGYAVFDKGYGQKMPYIDEAISKGWWVSPHAAHDTHDGNFAQTQQYTLVFSKTPLNSNELILEQIKLRHTLTSTSASARLLVSCHKGQQLMGSNNANSTDLSLSTQCLVEWDAGSEGGSIAQVTWFSLGEQWNWNGASIDLLNQEKNVALNLNLNDQQKSYFYLRVLKTDGNMIQTPPIGINW